MKNLDYIIQSDVQSVTLGNTLYLITRNQIFIYIYIAYFRFLFNVRLSFIRLKIG